MYQFELRPHLLAAAFAAFALLPIAGCGDSSEGKQAPAEPAELQEANNAMEDFMKANPNANKPGKAKPKNAMEAMQQAAEPPPRQ